MEDGAVGGFVQRGIAAAEQEAAIVEMGGATADGAETTGDRGLGARLLESVARADGGLMICWRMER